MENASKALLMAAEVLVGVLVLSLMVYLFITFGSNSSEIAKQMEENKLAEFNSQFDKYKGKSDITIHDIVSLANLAMENNEYYELTDSTESNYYISVVLIGEGAIEKKEQTLEKFEKKMTELLKKYVNTTFKCSNSNSDVRYSNTTGRIKQIQFYK